MSTKSIGLLAAGLLLSLGLASKAQSDQGHDHGGGYGEPGVAAQVNRTIALNASDDMRFSPGKIRVRQGETIRFVVSNVGKVRHEFSLGSRQDMLAHQEHMKMYPDMVHEDANRVTVEPGQKGEVIWTFSKAGQFDFACLYPGHFEAGMHGRIQVAKSR